MKKGGSTIRYRKGQVATEHLILTGIILVLVIPVLFYVSKDQTNTPYMSDAVNTIDKAVESLSNLGSGSTDTVVINVPGAVVGAKFLGCINANEDVKCDAIEVEYGDGSKDIFEMEYFVGGSVDFFKQKGIHYITMFNDGGNQQIVFQECGDGVVTGGEQCEFCEGPEDCKNGQACINNMCTVNGFESQCGKGCFDATSEFGCFCQCQLDVDCPYGICLDGVCIGCENDGDCNPGEFCSAGVCQECDQDGDTWNGEYNSQVCLVGGPYDCNDFEFLVNPGVLTELLCEDEFDNDCDGLKNCDDPDCDGIGSCGECVATGPEVCDDEGGDDEDCDGAANCYDDACNTFLGFGGVTCCNTGDNNCGVPTGLDYCTPQGFSYFEDSCDTNCEVIDDTSLCQASSFDVTCTAELGCGGVAPGTNGNDLTTCYDCTGACAYVSDTNIGTGDFPCVDCGNGYQLDTDDDVCYYGITCSSGLWNAASSEGCESYCLGTTSPCSQIQRDDPIGDTDCYSATCDSVTGCEYGLPEILRDGYCDVCSSSGVILGETCPGAGVVAGGECFYGTFDCTYLPVPPDDPTSGSCSLEHVAEPFPCTNGAWSDGAMWCTEEVGSAERCTNINTDSCPITGGWQYTTHFCDSYDVDYNEGALDDMNEYIVTSSSCTSSCTGSACCENTQVTCNLVNECKNFITDFINPLGSPFSDNPDNTNAICHRSNAGVNQWVASITQNTETACNDGYDNDCDGYTDGADADCPLTLQSVPASPQVSESTTFSLVESYIFGIVNICDFDGCNGIGGCVGVLQCSFTLPGATSCSITSPSTPGLYGYNACLSQNQDPLTITVLADAHCSVSDTHSAADSSTPAQYEHSFSSVWNVVDCPLDYNGMTCTCDIAGETSLSRSCDVYECQEFGLSSAGCFQSGSFYTDQGPFTCNDAQANFLGTCGSQFCDTDPGLGNQEYVCRKKDDGSGNNEWILKSSLVSAIETECNDGYDNDCDGLADELDVDDCSICYTAQDIMTGDIPGVFEKHQISDCSGGYATWILSNVTMCPGEELILKTGVNEVARIVLAANASQDTLLFDCQGFNITGNPNLCSVGAPDFGHNLIEISESYCIDAVDGCENPPVLDNRNFLIKSCELYNYKLGPLQDDDAKIFKIFQGSAIGNNITLVNNTFEGCGYEAGTPLTFFPASRPCIDGRYTLGNRNNYTLIDNNFTSAGEGFLYFASLGANNMVVGTNKCADPGAGGHVGYCDEPNTLVCPNECNPSDGYCDLTVCD